MSDWISFSNVRLSLEALLFVASSCLYSLAEKVRWRAKLQSLMAPWNWKMVLKTIAFSGMSLMTRNLWTGGDGGDSEGPAVDETYCRDDESGDYGGTRTRRLPQHSNKRQKRSVDRHWIKARQAAGGDQKYMNSIQRTTIVGAGGDWTVVHMEDTTQALLLPGRVQVNGGISSLYRIIVTGLGEGRRWE